MYPRQFFCVVTTSRIHHTYLMNKCRGNVSGLRGFKRLYLQPVLPPHISSNVEACGVNLMLIGPCIIAIVEEWNTNVMSLAILFHFLCAQHVSDINISIIRSLQLCCWITTSVVLFSVRCALEAGWSCASACKRNTTQNQAQQISNTQRTENKTTDVVIHQHSRKLLMMDILMSETCWAHNKWNKIASDIKLVFHASTITMMHGPINNRFQLYVHARKYPPVANRSEALRDDNIREITRIAF